MKTEEKHQVRGDEGKVQSLALPFGGSEAGAARKHHQQAVILAGVVPGAPTDIQSEDPREQRIPEMRDQASAEEQERDVNGEDAVLREFVVGMIRAIHGGHEMRVIAEQGQSIEGEGPILRGRGRNIIGQE